MRHLSMGRLSCFCFCKGNQFYANHNKVKYFIPHLLVVFAFAKVINFMLITTPMTKDQERKVLFLLLQR